MVAGQSLAWVTRSHSTWYEFVVVHAADSGSA